MVSMVVLGYSSYMFVKITTSGPPEYVKLVESYRNPAGVPRQRVIATFRFPDLGGSPDGTLDKSKGHFCSGFWMLEFLQAEFLQESSDSAIVGWAGHAVNLDGQCVGCSVGLDVSGRNE